MCGIMGYAGKRAAAKIVYGGLERLEYRGYDSAGIATLSGGGIEIIKKQGKVKTLSYYTQSLCGNIGIGHTRWATHGKPSDVNAHPHSSGRFALVHNGIIENYAELKAKYFSGVAFDSETDSEVIVRLLDKFYDGDFLGAIQKTCSLLKGSYALLVICAGYDGFAAVKYKSPVLLGSLDGEAFAASDAPALAGLCEYLTVPEDGDIALLSSGSFKLYDKDLNEVERKQIYNHATAASLDLNGCPHYMLKEIRENPTAVQNTFAVFGSVREQLKTALAGADRIIITGCGTAYNSGLVAKRFIERFARIPAEAEIAGEFRYKDPVITPTTAVIAISQSGETADTVEAARLAVSLGAKVIAVTNAPYSALTRIADVVVPVAAGPEICVAATKSYLGQIVALYLIACLISDRDFSDLTKIFPAVKDTVEHTDIDSLAKMCALANGVYFLGRDIDYAVALEGSLKMKEVTYIPCEGYPAGELKHGTLALIDEGKTAVVIITDERLAAKSENAVEQVLSRKGRAAVITNVDGTAKRLEDRVPVIRIPDCPPELSPLLTSTVVQLLAYRTAVILGRDPDKPRNLAKSVTVE